MPDRRMRDDGGAALASVAMILLVISIAVTLMLRQAGAVQSDAAFRAEDDELLAATEGETRGIDIAATLCDLDEIYAPLFAATDDEATTLRPARVPRIPDA